MKISISYKNIKPDEPLKTFVNEKLGGIDKFIGSNPVELRVEIGMPSKHHRSGEVFYAEANLKIGKTLLRAEAKHSDLRSAIIDAKKELQIQIKKFKDKIKDSSRTPKLV